MLNLDTHIVVGFLQGSLSAQERRIVEGERLVISAIVLWELARLVQLGRLVLDLRSRPFLAFLHNIDVMPIDLDVARASCSLDVRSDPADEIIAATSVVHHIPLLTRDRTLRKSKVVPLARTPRDSRARP